MPRKHWLWLIAAVVALVPAAGFAATGNGATQHFGPFASTSPDGSTCSVPWATDTFDRFFTVRSNDDGTFAVTEQFKNGSFVTNGATSPGACEKTSRHGTTVRAGVTGTYQGYLSGTVTGGTYDPSGCDSGDCTTTVGFVAAVFGSGADFSCVTGNGDCKFSFEYASGDNGLKYHAWKDASDHTGTEVFIGDIADQ